MAANPIRGYRDLIAWQKAMDLADGVFDLAARLRGPEFFGLADQLRRAAISIPANLAAGHGRRSRGEYIRYVSIANGSLRELETHLMLLLRRRVATAEDIGRLLAGSDEVGRLLTGLHRKLVAMTRPT